MLFPQSYKYCLVKGTDNKGADALFFQSSKSRGRNSVDLALQLVTKGLILSSGASGLAKLDDELLVLQTQRDWSYFHKLLLNHF